MLTNVEEIVGDSRAAYHMGKDLALAFASGTRIETHDVDDFVQEETSKEQDRARERAKIKEKRQAYKENTAGRDGF